MTFCVGPKAVTKFLYIHVSDEASGGNVSRMERGWALAAEPGMDKAIRGFAAFSAKVRIHSKDECTVDVLVNKLQSAVAERLTVDDFYAALEHHRHQCTQQAVVKQRKQKKHEIAENVKALRAEVAEPEPEVLPGTQREATQQRKG